MLMHCASSPVAGSSRDASGLPTETFLNVGALMSSEGTGVAGREAERTCLRKGELFSLFDEADAEASMLPRGVLEGVVGREMGGVGGMSPVTEASAWTARQSIFIAVSGRMSCASHWAVESGGEGAVERSRGPEPNRGIKPASSEGLGGQGGEVRVERTAAAAIVCGKAAVGAAEVGGGGVAVEVTVLIQVRYIAIFDSVGESSYCCCCRCIMSATMRCSGRLDVESAWRCPFEAEGTWYTASQCLACWTNGVFRGQDCADSSEMEAWRSLWCDCVR
jgi:hypothetical protein